MKFMPKHIILFSGCIIFSFIGYFIFQNFNSSPLEAVNISLSQSDKETNTGKLSKDISHSGGEWGGNPFATGITSTGNIKKPEFIKPNTDWKSRQITLKDGRTITYEFGKGNPSEVAQLSEEEKNIYKKCYFNTVVYAMDCPPDSQGRGQGYVTSDLEKDLMMLLSSPLWQSVLMKCEQQFRSSEISVLDFEANYDRVLFGEYISMEKLLIIDDRDGRKILSNNFGALLSWFSRAIRENREVMGSNVFHLNNCITQNGGLELYRMMDNIYQKQFYPS